MNILLIAIGSSGDVHPVVSLGLGLKARGHRVTLITNPHFRPLAERVGIDLIDLGTKEQYETIIELPEVWEPAAGFRLVAEWAILKPMRQTLSIVQELNVPGETVVAAPISAFGARIAQEAFGIPLVSVLLQPAMLRSTIDPPTLHGFPASRRMPRRLNQWLYWLADVALIDRLIAPETNAFRAEFGLPPKRRLFDDWMLSPTCALGLFPDWFADRPSDWPGQVRLTNFPLYDESDHVELAPDVADFLDAGEPPIVFTPGSAMRHGREFFTEAVDACQRLGRRGALLSRFRDQIPENLPSGIRSFDFVPFSQIFPRAAAVVHHGGIGTSAQGLAAGVPQLIMPLAHDQHDNAARLERLGVARSLSSARFKGPAVANRLNELIGVPQFRHQAQSHAAHLKARDSLAQSCQVIEEAVRLEPVARSAS